MKEYKRNLTQGLNVNFAAFNCDVVGCGDRREPNNTEKILFNHIEPTISLEGPCF